MEKLFNINGIEYSVEKITAIAASAGEYSEDHRQSALLIVSESNGENAEYVVFGFEMPEDNDDFISMLDEPSAWDSDWETLESVRKDG